MKNSNVQGPQVLKIDFTIDNKDLFNQVAMKLLELEVKKINELARIWGVPDRFFAENTRRIGP